MVGTSCVATDLFLADVDERYWVPPANNADYRDKVLALTKHVKPDFMHLQNDFEVRAISRMREEIVEQGIKLFMPRAEVIENCVDKNASYKLWRAAGVRTPETILLRDEGDLKASFDRLGETIWLRAIEGGGGKGAVATSDFEFGKRWIDRFKGWGMFTAAELLSPETVTWLSIWHEGELVVAQTRRRRNWSFGDRTLSGVTGVTGVGETYSAEGITQISLDAIAAVDDHPHGIYGVDITYDLMGRPNVTEINISRFFTTVHFFTAAGLNMPRIFVDIGLYDQFPSLERKINPLPDGLLWIRGMDRPPVLAKVEDVDAILGGNPNQ